MSSIAYDESAFRERLQEVTQAPDWMQYLSLLAAVARDFPNEIVLLESAHPIEKYTCFVHVFEFTEKPEYTAIAKWGFNVVFAGPVFAHWLLEKNLLVEMAEPHEGDIILYFDEQGRIKHAGLSCRGGRVESKWGKGGLFQHGLFEVPVSYGVNVRFFKKLSYEEALKYFRLFAKEKGMLFQDY